MGDILTIEMAAKILNVSTKQVRIYIHSGELKASNISQGNKQARWRIRREDIDDFIKSKQVKV